MSKSSGSDGSVATVTSTPSCTNCGTTKTSSWRHLSGKRACKACYTYHLRNGMHRSTNGGLPGKAPTSQKKLGIAHTHPFKPSKGSPAKRAAIISNQSSSAVVVASSEQAASNENGVGSPSVKTLVKAVEQLQSLEVENQNPLLAFAKTVREAANTLVLSLEQLETEKPIVSVAASSSKMS